jgi:hypothetical protein
MSCLLEQVVLKRQRGSLNLYGNVRPSLTARAKNLGLHLFSNPPDRVDTLATWMQVIFRNENDPDGGCTGGVLAEAKFKPSHSGGQVAVLACNVIKKPRFVI